MGSRCEVRTMVIALALVMVVGGCATGPSKPATQTPSASGPGVGTPEQMTLDVDIGGRTLHLFCMGSSAAGTPTVVAEAGLGSDSRTWNDTIRGVAAKARMCVYDRAGLRSSPPAPQLARTLQDQVDDLALLLTAAPISGPYVLVGHSSGSWIVSLYAAQHPANVVGVVFAEPRGPHVSRDWLAALPPAAPGEPEAVRLNREELTVFETDPSLNDEHQDLAASARQLGAVIDPPAPLFGERPLIVMSAARTPEMWSDLPADLRATFDEIWFDGQKALLAESTESSFVTIADSDHDLPGWQPEAVVAAIFEVMDRAAS